MGEGSSAIATKIRSKFGKFLTLADYKILTQKGDINDAITFISSLPQYSEAFKGTAGMALRRGTAEEVFEKHFYSVYEELLNFSFTVKEGFISYYIKREEIRQIINAATYIGAGVSDLIAYNFPAFLVSDVRFDVNELMASADFRQFVSALENTDYYNILLPLADSVKFPEIPVIEKALIDHYYTWLLESIKNGYPDEEQPELEKCVRHAVDIHNLKLCYRLKGLLGLSAEETEKYIIELYGSFKKEDIVQLLSAGDSKEMLQQIVKLPWLNVEPETADKGFEYILGISDYKYYRSRLFMSENESIVLYSFMDLLRKEKGNLITVIEGIRYSVDPSQIENMLIIP